jgi:hypothetical protein
LIEKEKFLEQVNRLEENSVISLQYMEAPIHQALLIHHIFEEIRRFAE